MVGQVWVAYHNKGMLATNGGCKYSQPWAVEKEFGRQRATAGFICMVATVGNNPSAGQIMTLRINSGACSLNTKLIFLGA